MEQCIRCGARILEEESLRFEGMCEPCFEEVNDLSDLSDISDFEDTFDTD